MQESARRREGGFFMGWGWREGPAWAAGERAQAGDGGSGVVRLGGGLLHEQGQDQDGGGV